MLNREMFLSTATNSLLRNLISYWKLDETSGNALDSWGSNNATTTSVTQGVSGKIGTAYSFLTASNNYVDIPNTPNLNFGYGDFSIGFWVKIPGSVGALGIITKNFATTWGVFNVGATIGLYIQSGGLSNSINISSYYNQWIYVLWIVDNLNNIQKSYLNGIFNNQTNNAVGNLTDITNVNFGKYANSRTGYWTGSLDEIGIWNRILTPNEILQLYNSGNGLTFPFY